jgi:hypothetical protein
MSVLPPQLRFGLASFGFYIGTGFTMRSYVTPTTPTNGVNLGIWVDIINARRSSDSWTTRMAMSNNLKRIKPFFRERIDRLKAIGFVWANKAIIGNNAG